MAGTTSTTVSYLGELFQSGKRPNALLRLLGGFNGVMESTSPEFPVGVTWTLPSPSQPANLEGANAPTPNTRSLSQSTNVVQIFQEAVSVSYLGQSSKAISGVVPIPTGEANGQVQNPRSTEFQVMTTLAKIAQDANYSFMNGAFVNPGDPSSTALKTRGILTAISTNSTDKSADTAGSVTPAIYRGYIDTLLASIIQYNGFQIDETWSLMCGVTEFANACAAYAALGTIYLQPETDIVGVKVRKILTKFGTLNLVLDPDVPNQFLGIFNLGVCGVVGLPVPNKGILFEEQLFKQGSADQTMIYGQLGIDHGPEFSHGKLKVASGIAL